jgi:hypothetical protein
LIAIYDTSEEIYLFEFIYLPPTVPIPGGNRRLAAVSLDPDPSDYPNDDYVIRG